MLIKMFKNEYNRHRRLKGSINLIIHCLISVVHPPSDLFVTYALESELLLTWYQIGEVDHFTLYWKAEHGSEYNMTIPGNETVVLLNDSLTPATMFYISLAAVIGFHTSSRSHTVLAATGMCYLCIIMYM